MKDDDKLATDSKVVVLVYSDDRNVRTDVIDALGPTLGGYDVEVREAATQAAVLTQLDQNRKTDEIDCCIFDAEATPMGGMGLSKQIRDEYDPCPPVLLLVARPADSWLATWSRAEAIHPYPIDPLTLPKQVESLAFIDEEDAAAPTPTVLPAIIDVEDTIITDVQTV